MPFIVNYFDSKSRFGPFNSEAAPTVVSTAQCAESHGLRTYILAYNPCINYKGMCYWFGISATVLARMLSPKGLFPLRLRIALRGVARRPIVSDSWRSNVLHDSCLHDLLPHRRDSEILSRLRRHTVYPIPRTKTNKYRSFIHYALAKYQ